MRIRTVEYRRLRTFGGYQNETIGATADVAEDETPEAALLSLRQWVDMSLGDESERRELERRISELRFQADNYERRIKGAEERWQAILGFLQKLGIERPADIPDDLADLPF